MKALLKTGKIIEIIPNDDLNAAKYVDKETSEYIFDDEIVEILTDETKDVKDTTTEYEHNRVYESETLKDIKEAAIEWSKIFVKDECKEACHYGFLTGAKWQKEQMMKGAVKGEIIKDSRGNNVVRAGVFNKDFECGDDVRVIVLPRED